MATKRTINVNGQDLEVVDVDFEPAKAEAWNEYVLADGGRIRIKLSVNRVLQVLAPDGSHARTPEGDRFLVVQSNNQLVIQD
jgi:hypothetical protein